MKKLFAIAASQRVASLTLGAAIGLALCLAGAPVRAENCPRGQFFWKTKKSCIDKAEAAKLGIYHGPVPAAKASDKVETEKPQTEKPEEPAPETNPASDAAVALPAPEGTPPAAEPAVASAPRPSPYGELVIEDFAKAK